jgi:predicted nucleic acid-binding protein
MVKPHTAGHLREVAVSTHSQILELMRVLRDAVARAVFIEEAIEEGDTAIAWSVARDLEIDLRAAADWEGKR